MKNRRKRNKTRRFVLYGLLSLVIISAALVSFLTAKKYNISSQQFVDDGYMLLAASKNGNAGGAINAQYYFNAGEKYRVSYDDTVVFNDSDGNKITAETQNFIHYNNGSMNGLSESVVFDTDDAHNEQLSYYAFSLDTFFRKTGTGYSVNNGGNPIEIKNFLWKISNDRYMVVSNRIDLVVSEESQQTFNEYVELRYIDEGIAHIVTQSGTYSTISSDAYLLLENGIRIYIGSKNLSDGENVIMNMSDMVVGSDDNIDVIPDEDYTIEQNKQPQIVVNATDGQNGTNGDEGVQGDAGESGEQGNQGNGGSRGNKGGEGQEGTPGNKGNGSEYGDAVYEEIKRPIFSPVNLTSTSYGVTSDISFSYAPNDCVINKAWVQIIENKTGNQVYLRNVDLTNTDINISANTATGNTADVCNILNSNTNYTYNVYCEYSLDGGSTYTTQIMNQQTFTTDSMGVKIVEKYTTSDSLVLDFSKDANSKVTDIAVRVYDSEFNLIGYAKVKEENALEGNNKDYNIVPLQAGTKVEMVLDNTDYKALDSNSVYYAQISILGVDTEDPDNPANIVPSGSQELVRLQTLKKLPEVNSPRLEVSERTNSFVITPSSVKDVDKGVVGYRYEIYSTDDKLVWSSDEYSTLMTVQVPIGKKGDDNPVKRDTPYYARLVAIFNDNKTVSDYPSDKSNTARASDTAYPEITIVNEIITPTTIEGWIKIDGKDVYDPVRDAIEGDVGPNALDVDSTIFLNFSTKDLYENDSKKPLKIEINDDLGYGIKLSNINKTSPDSGEAYYDIEQSVYLIPFSIRDLKSNMQESDKYIISAYTDHLVINGAEQVAQGTRLMFDSCSFKTPDYTPLYVDGVVNNDDNHQFNVSLVLSSSNVNNDSRNEVSKYYGQMDNIAGRSVGTVMLSLYNADNLQNVIATKYISLFDDVNYQYNFNNNSIFDKAYSEQIIGITQDHYVQLSSGDKFADIYKDHTDSPNTYLINLTEDSGWAFENNPSTSQEYSLKDFQEGSEFVIKVDAYDYTYGTYGDQDGIIQVGRDAYSSESKTDSYVDVTLTYKIPDVPEDLGEIVNISLSNASNYYEDDALKYHSNLENGSNISAIEDLEDYWDNKGLLSTTYVGACYEGPSDLAAYASKIVYEVLDENGQLVTSSGEIDVVANDNGIVTLPGYVFFTDVVDNNTGKQINRGDIFTIRTKILLRGKEDKGYYPEKYWEEDGTGSVSKQHMDVSTCLAKTKPQIYFLPYEGSENSDTLTVYYQLVDIDNAVVTDNGKISLFYKDGETEETVTISAVDNPTDVYNGFEAIKFNLPSDSQLYFKAQLEKDLTTKQWKTETYNSLKDIKNQMNKESSIDFLLERPDGTSGVLNEIRVDYDPDSDARYATLYFLYQPSSNSENDLLVANVKFSNSNGDYTYKGNDLKLVSTEFSYSKDGVDLTGYKVTAKLDVYKLSSILNDEDLKVEIELFYDAGDYGSKYMDKEATLPDRTTDKSTVGGVEYTITKGKTVFYLIESRSKEEITGNYLGSNYVSIQNEYLLSKLDLEGGNFTINGQSVSVLDASKHNITLNKKGDTLSYEKDGLYKGTSKVNIKSVNSVVCEFTTDAINSILPVAYITDETINNVGLTTTEFDIKLTTSSHTLVKDEGLYVEFTNKSTNEKTYTKLNFNDAIDGITWKDVTFGDLKKGTEYQVCIYGFDNTKGPVKYLQDGKTIDISNWKNITTEVSKGSNKVRYYTIKTKNAYELGNDTLTIREYTSTNPEVVTRESKVAVYTLNIPNVMLSDLRENLVNDSTNPCIEVKLTTTNGASETIKLTLSELLGENDANFIISGDASKGRIAKTLEFDYKPMSDKTHLMDETESDFVDVQITYYFQASPGFVGNKDVKDSKKFTIESWPAIDARITVTPVLDEANGDPIINYTINGLDKNRIIPEDSTGKIPVIVEFNDKLGDDWVQFETSTDKYVSRKVVYLTPDTSGNIEPYTITIEGLDRGNSYNMVVYYLADINNINISPFNITNEELEKMDNSEVNTLLGSGNCLSAKSTRTDTSESSVLDVYGLVIRNDGYAEIFGDNLNTVKKIYYVYSVGSGKSVKVTLTGDDVKTAFKPSSGYSGKYELKLNGFVSSKSYLVTIYFYDDEGTAVGSGSNHLSDKYTPR